MTDGSGWARVTGVAGAAADRRAQMVRIINLCTADQVAAPVRPDGSFQARVFAPPGSWLQINTNMLRIEELPPELRVAMRRSGYITPSDVGHAVNGPQSRTGQPWVR